MIDSKRKRMIGSSRRLEWWLDEFNGRVRSFRHVRYVRHHGDDLFFLINDGSRYASWQTDGHVKAFRHWATRDSACAPRAMRADG